MKKEYGIYKKIEKSKEVESLSICFSPSNTTLQQRWRNNGLSADFMGDYVTSFFPVSNNDAMTRRIQEEIKSSVSYISNELLENAMKYSNENSDSEISLTLFLAKDKIYFELNNSLSENKKNDYISFIKSLDTADPFELYIKHIEENSIKEASGGLGCLTIMSDYNTVFSWVFDGNSKNNLTVLTQIILIV